jgi:hypothetical protein
MSTTEHALPLAASPKPAEHKFRGCCPIQKYEMLEKLGEGTFGYGSSGQRD